MRKLALAVFFIFPFASPLFSQVDTAWVRRYDGPGNSSDWANAIAVDNSGNVYVTGRSYGSGTSYDYATIKYYPDGDTAWVRRYDGGSWDEAYAIAVDRSGNVCVTGKSMGTYYDYATVKHYPNGDTAWVRRYNGMAGSDDEACAIAVDDSGNVYVTGWSTESETYPDYATIKYYPDGDTAWLRTYDYPEVYTDEVACDMVVDASNNVYVTGYIAAWADDVYATIKYYPNGDSAWVGWYNHTEPEFCSDYASAVAVDDSGNVYVTGYSWGGETNYDCATIKYDADGDTVWAGRYNGPADSDDEAYDIAVDDCGNVYVTGYGYDGLTYEDYLTVKYHPNGDTAWARRYNGPGDYCDAAFAMSVDGPGNAYVTGYSVGAGTGYDYATVRYYPNGDTAWATRYNGPGNSLDLARAVAIDDSGNVYVTGLSYGGGTSHDYATIKYRQHNDPPDPFSLIFPHSKGLTPRIVGFDWESATDPNPFDQLRYDLYVSTSSQFSEDSTTIDSNLTVSEHVKTLDYGIHFWKVKAKDNFGAERWSYGPRCFTVTGFQASLGDFNLDGSIDGGDVVFLINYLYTSGPPPDPLELGDVNCDDSVDLGDAIFLINYLFKNGPRPSC